MDVVASISAGAGGDCEHDQNEYDLQKQFFGNCAFVALMVSFLLLVVYCVIIVAGSLLGGWLPSLLRLTHRRMQFMISMVAGLMLGVAVLHLLPHSIHYTDSVDQSVLWLLAGLLGMFFLVRAFHFHHHGPAEPVHGDHHDHHHEHGHDHDHGHDHHLDPREMREKHRLGWVGVALGLGLHTAIDGIALAAAVRAESHGALLPGLAIFLAIVLHKPLDALSITTLMAAGGWSFRSRQFVNLGFALMCPLGAILFYLGVGADQNVVIGCALALAAGAFLCIALGDLLPEVQFHSHDKLGLSACLLLGIAAAYAIGYLEHGMHGHEPDHNHAPQRDNHPLDDSGHRH